jgi:benzoyl-CoA 2,3-dioxygenase component A
MSVSRQHLIDPEICIRCNTCEETCPVNAITHNEDNYVVDPGKCNFCLDCISPCPTGSIDNWRMVEVAYSVQDQFKWAELPEQIELSEREIGAGGDEAKEEDAARILSVAHSGQGGKVVPPFTAAHPYVNVYSREHPAIAKVTGNFRITDSGSESDVRHIILDFDSQKFPVLEGQSIGIIPPGADEKGRPHLVRLYSVASPRDGERPNTNNLSLTVKRVIYEENGQMVGGVGSNYLCDLRKGEDVQVTGPFGASFLMPNHPSANIMMICTGTGSAPFRAMTERRRRYMYDAPGRLTLFFGARAPSELPYFGPLQKLNDEFIDKQLVFSRWQKKEKEYVQHRMLARSTEVGALIRDDETHVYICGLKDMEKGVEEAFATICTSAGMDWCEVKAAMRRSGRYHVETY